MFDSRQFWRAAALTSVFSAVSVTAMYFDAKPSWLGLAVLFVLTLCSGLIGGRRVGALTGLFSSAAGIYIKIYHYYIPEKLRGIPAALQRVDLTEKELEKLKKLTASIDKFHGEMAEYGEFLQKYMPFLILAAVLLGWAAGKYLCKRGGAPVNAETATVKADTPQSAAYRKEARSIFDVRTLTYMSAFIALGVAINSLRVGNVSFAGFPIIYSGFALGPIPGFIVGAMTDFIGFIARPSANGAFHPAFALTSALTGLLPALVVSVPFLKQYRKRVLVCFFAILIGQFITSVLMVPLFRYWLFEHPLMVTATNAAVKQIYSVPLYTFFYLTLDKAVQSSRKLNLVRAKH